MVLFSFWSVLFVKMIFSIIFGEIFLLRLEKMLLNSQKNNENLLRIFFHFFNMFAAYVEFSLIELQLYFFLLFLIKPILIVTFLLTSKKGEKHRKI